MSDIKVFDVNDLNNKLDFTLDADRYIGGISYLMQWSIKLLLDSKDAPLSPGEAGNLQQLIGLAATDDEKQAIVSEGFRRVENFMKQQQRNTDLPGERLLKDMELLGVSTDELQTTKVRYRIQNQANQQADVGLPVERP